MAAADVETTYADIDVVLPGTTVRDVRERSRRGAGHSYDLRVRGRELRAVYRPSARWVPAWQFSARLAPEAGGVRVLGRFGQPWTWVVTLLVGVPAVPMLALAVLALLGGDEAGIGLGVVGLVLAGLAWWVRPRPRPCSQAEHAALCAQLSAALSRGPGDQSP